MDHNNYFNDVTAFVWSHLFGIAQTVWLWYEIRKNRKEIRLKNGVSNPTNNRF